MVTRRGRDAVVILSAQDYRRISGSPGLLKSLLGAPRGESLEIERIREPIPNLVL